MPIDFTRFLQPYQPQFRSTGASSSFDQMLANRGAAQRNQAQLAAQLEQSKLEDAARMERERFKAQADADAAAATRQGTADLELEKRRRDYMERLAKASRSGNAEDVMALRAEAEALGFNLERQKEEARLSPVPERAMLERPGDLARPEAPDASVGAGMELRDPTAGIGALDANLSSRDVINIRKGDELVGTADVGGTLAANQAQIRKVAGERILSAREKDRAAEEQYAESLYNTGAPIAADTFETAKSRADRESRERDAAAGRAVALHNAEESRNLTRSLTEGNQAIARERLKGQQEKDEKAAAARDERERRAWRRDAETIGKKQGVEARREAMESLGKVVDLLDSDNGRSQVAAVRNMAMSLNKGGLTQADVDAVNMAMGLLQRWEQTLERNAYNKLGDAEKAEFDAMLSDLVVSLESAHTQAYKNMLEQAPVNSDDPAAMQEFTAYLRANFRGLPEFDSKARAPEGGYDDVPAEPVGDGDSFEADLQNKYGVK